MAHISKLLLFLATRDQSGYRSNRIRQFSFEIARRYLDNIAYYLCCSRRKLDKYGVGQVGTDHPRRHVSSYWYLRHIDNGDNKLVSVLHSWLDSAAEKPRWLDPWKRKENVYRSASPRARFGFFSW